MARKYPNPADVNSYTTDASNSNTPSYDPNNPLDPNNPNNPATGKPWVQAPTNLAPGTPWGNPGASPLTNLGYFTNEPGILSRTLMKSYGTPYDANGFPGMNGPYAGNAYGQDPFSQYLQDKFLAAATLGTYLAPANDFDPRTQLGNAQGYVNGLYNPFGSGTFDKIRNSILPYMSKFAAGDVSGLFANPDSAAPATAALSLWKDPQADMRLVQSALSGLPAPLSNALGSMATTIYNMYQDKLPSLPSGESFLQWLMG